MVELCGLPRTSNSRGSSRWGDRPETFTLPPDSPSLSSPLRLPAELPVSPSSPDAHNRQLSMAAKTCSSGGRSSWPTCNLTRHKAACITTVMRRLDAGTWHHKARALERVAAPKGSGRPGGCGCLRRGRHATLVSRRQTGDQLGASMLARGGHWQMLWTHACVRQIHSGFVYRARCGASRSAPGSQSDRPLSM